MHHAPARTLLTTHSTMVRYFCIGISASIVDVLGYLFLYNVLGVYPVLATIASISISTIYAFTLNILFNFKTKDRLIRRFVSYATVSASGLVVGTTLIAIFVSSLSYDPNIAKLFTLPPVFLIQYLLNKRFSFGSFLISEPEVERHPDDTTTDTQPKKSGRVAVLGGGFSGLTAAYRLSKKGYDVTLYERGSVVGGLASGFDFDGVPLERAYHFLYQTDTDIISLTEELGIRDTLTFYKSSVSSFYNGILYPFGGALDLLRFTPLSLISRIRTGLVALYLQRLTQWRPLQQVTAHSWLNRWCGAEATTIIWEPLLKGKFNHFYDKVTMSWLWRRFAIRANSRDPKRGEVLGYFTGGFRRLTHRLVEAIERAGGTIALNTSTQRIVRNSDGTLTVTTDNGTRVYDAVIATTPSPVFARFIADNPLVPAEYTERLQRVDYLGAVVLVFETDEAITPYYWHNINDVRVPFLVFLSLSALVGTETIGGKHIYYIGAYVPHDHPYFTQDNARITEEWYQGLSVMFPSFTREHIVNEALFKFKDAQHIVDVGYEAQKLVPFETPLPGVFLANFSQIYPDDRGTNFAVRDGTAVAERAHAYLEHLRVAPPPTICTEHPELSIVLPTYNEEKNVTPILSRIRASLEQAGITYEVVFVDDGTDHTADIARMYGAYDARIRVIHREGADRAGGLATAFMDGYRAARGRYVVCMDSDLQHPPEQLPLLYEEANGGGVDLVIASRFADGGSDRTEVGSLHRKIITQVFKFITHVLVPASSKTSDPMTGFFLVRHGAIDVDTFRPDGFKILLEILGRTPHISTKNVPLSIEERQFGETKADMTQALRFFKHLARLAYDNHRATAWGRVSSALVSSVRSLSAAQLGWCVFLLASLFGALGLYSITTGVVSVLFLTMSLLLIAQGGFAIYLMVYGWDDPEYIDESKSPKQFSEPHASFTALIPVRHEEAVIGDTLKAVASINYPEHLKETIVICRTDDTGTIAAIERTLETLQKPNVRLVVFDGFPINKPHQLNIGLKEAHGDIVTIFDAEDEPHPDIYHVVNTVFDTADDVDIIQSGVQLMDYDSHWYSVFNVLEYFFWFKSVLHFFARRGFIPLGGNTVFFKKRFIDSIGGWDQEKLTEDADVGVRLSTLGAKTRVVYDAQHTTQEETPHTVFSFIKQRTRWNQGFLQILFDGAWVHLPKRTQRLLAAYVLMWPIVQALLFFIIPLSLYIAFTVDMPVTIVMVGTIPLYLLITQLVLGMIGLYEFTREYNKTLPIAQWVVMPFTFILYQLILSFSAFRATMRLVTAKNTWEKTAHTNVHRTASSASNA